MQRKLATFLMLFGTALSLPAQALAQTANPPWDTWYGPWFMGGWASWWWMCPLMLVLMLVAMMLACRFMSCGWRRD